MGVWEFVVVYLAAFVLIQLVVYRYLRGDDDETRVAWAGSPNAETRPPDDREGHERREGPDRPARDRPTVAEAEVEADAEADASAGRRCPTCGTRNEPDSTYTFCRNCASRLPG